MFGQFLIRSAVKEDVKSILYLIQVYYKLKMFYYLISSV